MKVADLKRLNVGDTLTIIKHGSRVNNQLNVTRPITIMQTNSLALATKYKGEIVNGWLDFPKASMLESNSDNIFTINYGEGHFLTYQVNK